jgi:uncharacterized protein (TIGR02598 family)
LIEIMVALVVIAVGLIAIVGLIPQGLQSSRSAADNTLVATIVHDTFSQMRITWPPASIDIFYDATGLNSFPAASTSPDRHFHVVATAQVSPSLPQLYTVTAVVTWPAKALVPVNTNVFFTQMADYRQ